MNVVVVVAVVDAVVGISVPPVVAAVLAAARGSPLGSAGATTETAAAATIATTIGVARPLVDLDRQTRHQRRVGSPSPHPPRILLLRETHASVEGPDVDWLDL